MPPAFANRTALLVARDAWCTNPTAAAANYGPIAQWDVTLVTDLSFLFCANVRYQNRGCNTACSTFNDDISGWNVSATNTEQTWRQCSFQQQLLTGPWMRGMSAQQPK